MRYIIFILICISQIANSQINDFQIKGSTPKDTLFVLGTDTTAAGTKRGLGKWYNAYDLVNGLAVGGGGGTTNLSIAQSGGTQVIQSSTGTDVGVRNLYGLLITEGATDTLHFRVDTAYIATLYDLTQIPISSLKAATATNTINNANYAQEWQWNTLAGISGLKLSSTSTAAASSLQKLFELSLSGASVSGSQSTYAAYFSNTHTGGASSNYGLYSTASGGSVNIGITAATTGSGYAVYANATSGKGVYSFTTTGLPLQLEAAPTSTSTIVNIADLYRNTSGTAANGIGGSLTFTTQTATSSAVSNTISSKWTTATHASRVSDFIVSGVNNAVTADLLTVKGSGQTVLNKYGVGSFTSGTPVYNVLVDASGNLMEGAVPVGGTNSIEENNSVVQSANVSLDFQNPFDVATDGASEVNISLDCGEFTTVTTVQSDDYMLMHDSGAAANEKILWSDVIIDLVSFKDDNSSVGTGNAIDVGDGLEFIMSPSTEANLNLDFGELLLDGTPEANGTEYFIVYDSDTTSGHRVQRFRYSDVVGGSDTNFAEDDLTFTGNRTHDLGANTLTLSGSVANVTFKDNNGGTGDNVIIVSELGAGTGVTGGISFESQNGGTPTDMFDLEANKLATNESTFTIKSEQGTDAHTVFEKNAGLADNTTESHMAMNAGRAYTQNYEWTATGADLTLDRSYNIVNVTGAGAIGDEINLPEAASTSDNFDTGLTDAQVQVGQEYTITALRNASTGLVLRPFTGDLINGAASITLPYSANGTSVVVKLVRWSGGVGQWFTY